MARMARIVIPDVPHHVTQRGARRQEIFFEATDYKHYLTLMAANCRKAGTDVWAYCLMPNHVHLVMVPRSAGGLRAALGRAHRQYALDINQRNEWRGHLWQERFYSCPMDEQHLLAAARYVEWNPPAAGLCAAPSGWPWWIARAHLEGGADPLVDVRPLLDRVDDWGRFLSEERDERVNARISEHSRTGRPLGNDAFIEWLERVSGRVLRPRRPGRLRRAASRSDTLRG